MPHCGWHSHIPYLPFIIHSKKNISVAALKYRHATRKRSGIKRYLYTCSASVTTTHSLHTGTYSALFLHNYHHIHPLKTIQRTRYTPVTTRPIPSPRRGSTAFYCSIIQGKRSYLRLICNFSVVVTPLHHFISPHRCSTMLPSYRVLYVSVLRRSHHTPHNHKSRRTLRHTDRHSEISTTAFANASALHYRSGNSNLACKREKSCGFFVRRKIPLTTFPHIHCDHTFPCHSYIIRLCYPFQVTKW